MIRIVILGRTGNNIFQYALGRALAAKHGVPLVMDGSWFATKGWDEVSHFLRTPIKATVRRHPTLASRALRKLTGKHYWEYRDIPVIRENCSNHTFDPAILNAPADCMIFGYFQSPLYFDSIKDEFRAEMRGLLAAAITPHPALLAKLCSENAVAVHVRRTDYLSIPAHQVCGGSYHHKAMAKLRESLDSPRFYIFSDDPTWCRQRFTLPDQEIVDAGPFATNNPLHDLHLMSLARHHIIMNSTYSWWAAWLGEKADQQVIMPDRWFASGIHAPVEEKTQPHWITVPAGTP